jgi:hypothetical protein
MTSAMEIPGRKSAVVLMALFLAGFIAQILLVRTDRRTALEEVQFPTAVGDTSYFPVPEGLAAGDLLVRFEGRVLVAATGKIENMPGFRLDRVGRDETGRFAIYRLNERKNGAEEGFLFLKTGPKHFLAVREQTSVSP